MNFTFCIKFPIIKYSTFLIKAYEMLVTPPRTDWQNFLFIHLNVNIIYITVNFIEIWQFPQPTIFL